MSEKEFFKKIDKNFPKIVQLYKSLIQKSGSHKFETELFKKLLDEDFDINYRIPDNYNIFQTDWVAGCTISHLIGSIPDLHKVLIDRGADYTVKDKEGSTVLLRETTNSGYRYNKGTTEVYDETISTGYGHYLRSLSDRDGSRHSADDKETCANIILSAHINSKNPTNPKDKNGLTHFHVACMYNRADVANYFLDNGIPINETVSQDSKFYPGFSALHFAVKSCAVETVELLLTRGADIFAKDSKDRNPLHIVMLERKKIFVKVKIYLKTTSSDEPKINLPERFATSIASSLFKYSNLYNHFVKNQKIIYLLLERISEHGHHFIDDTQLTYFHVLCFMENASIINELLDNNIQLLSQSISTDSPIWPGYTALHFAANFSVETVELLVKRGADLSAKDAKGVTPFEICLKEFTIADIHRILSQQPVYSSIVFSDGKTKLYDFFHAMQKTATLKNFLRENLTDPNMFIPCSSPVCAGCTPIHLSVICTEHPISWSSKNYDNCADSLSYRWNKYCSRINLCLSYDPVVTTTDARGSTPLHWAFKLQQGQLVRELLKLHKTNSNCVDKDGLSHLHIACAAGNETVVQKLLTGGANVNVVVMSSYTWLEKDEIGGITIEGIFDKYFINKGSSPLHFAIKWPKIVEILIKHGADVLAQDIEGLNPLERLWNVHLSGCTKPTRLEPFIKDEEKVVELLLKEMGKRLADTKPRQVLYSYGLLENKLLVKMLDLADESTMKFLESVEITPLHVACFIQDLERVNELTGKIDVNTRVNPESPLWPGCTPLHLFMKSATLMMDERRVNWTIATKLFERGADVGAVNSEGETPIHEIFLFSWKYLHEMLKHLQDSKINPISKKGFSHLHIASACGAVPVVQQLLEHGAAIDQPTDYFIKNYAGFTAIHFAALYDRKDVVDVLLKHGADVNWRNALGENSLHVACKRIRQQPCLGLLKSLIGARADVHAKNMYGETPFRALLESSYKLKEEIELFSEHNCLVNIFDSVSSEGLLAMTLNKNSFPFFEKVVTASDVKDVDSNGRNAIHNAVAFKLPDKEYFDDEYSEDEDTDEYEFEDTIYNKFTPRNDYIKAIDLLIELGVNIDQRDCEGSTPLHIAAQMQNFTGIIGLLENGADINVTDTNGNTAFVYSLELAECQDVPGFRILEIISSHMHKLNLAKIGISKTNRQINEKILEKSTICVSRINKYTDEIERMRKEQITSTSLALCKFLSDTDAISAFPRMQLCEKTAIETFFKNETKSLREKFPQFAGILLLQYRKALARGGLIDPAASSLDILVGFDMPIICTDMILKFLSNDELNSLISSVAIE